MTKCLPRHPKAWRQDNAHSDWALVASLMHYGFFLVTTNWICDAIKHSIQSLHLTTSYVVLFLYNRLAMPVEFPHLYIILPTHSHSLPSRITFLQELSQPLLALLQRLGGSCIRHLIHWTPQIKRVGNIGAHTEEDECDEIDGVAKDCAVLVLCAEVVLASTKIISPATISFHPSAKSNP